MRTCSRVWHMQGRSPPYRGELAAKTELLRCCCPPRPSPPLHSTSILHQHSAALKPVPCHELVPQPTHSALALPLHTCTELSAPPPALHTMSAVMGGWRQPGWAAREAVRLLYTIRGSRDDCMRAADGRCQCLTDICAEPSVGARKQNRSTAVVGLHAHLGNMVSRNTSCRRVSPEVDILAWHAGSA